MKLQEFLHKSIEEAFVGKTVVIKNDRIHNTVNVVDVEIKSDHIILKTDNQQTSEIKIALEVMRWGSGTFGKCTALHRKNQSCGWSEILLEDKQARLILSKAFKKR